MLRGGRVGVGGFAGPFPFVVPPSPGGGERFRASPVFLPGLGRMRVAKNHGSHIKNDALYETLRGEGASKQKAARIANAQANGRLDPAGGRLEDRTKAELYDTARKIGIEGRSQMDKAALVKAIRAH